MLWSMSQKLPESVYSSCTILALGNLQGDTYPKLHCSRIDLSDYWPQQPIVDPRQLPNPSLKLKNSKFHRYLHQISLRGFTLTARHAWLPGFPLKLKSAQLFPWLRLLLTVIVPYYQFPSFLFHLDNFTHICVSPNFYSKLFSPITFQIVMSYLNTD